MQRYPGVLAGPIAKVGLTKTIREKERENATTNINFKQWG
jgi:hypothetical protein